MKIKNTNIALVILLAVQTAAAVALWKPGPEDEAEERSLFDIQPDQVVEVIIKRQPGELKTDHNESIRIARTEFGWVLPDYENFPARADKVNELLGSLLLAKVRRPVTEKPESHAALNVGETNFAKHITLNTEDKEYSLYAGSSQAGSMHARFEDDNEVYLAKGVQSWKISHEIRDYADIDYVDVQQPTELKIFNQHGKIDLSMQPDGTWVVSQLPSDKPVDLGRVRTLVNAARSLKLDLPKGRTLDPAFGLGDQARATVFIKGPTGSAQYSIGSEDGAYVHVKAEGQDFVVLISKFNVSQMMDIQVDQLIDKTKLQKAAPAMGTPLPRELWPKDPVPGPSAP